MHYMISNYDWKAEFVTPKKFTIIISLIYTTGLLWLYIKQCPLMLKGLIKIIWIIKLTGL